MCPGSWLDKKYRLNPDHVKDISDTAWNAPKQRSHPIPPRSTSVNKVQIGEYTVKPFKAVEYIRHYDTLSWIKS